MPVLSCGTSCCRRTVRKPLTSSLLTLFHVWFLYSSTITAQLRSEALHVHVQHSYDLSVVTKSCNHACGSCVGAESSSQNKEPITLNGLHVRVSPD